MGTRSFRPFVAPFVVGITTRLFGNINNHYKKQILFRLTMASSLSPICSSPELEELKKSIYDHKDYVSLLSIVCQWPHSHWQGGYFGDTICRFACPRDAHGSDRQVEMAVGKHWIHLYYPDSQCLWMMSTERPPLPASIHHIHYTFGRSSFFGVVLSTGGIKTRGGTYAPGLVY